MLIFFWYGSYIKKYISKFPAGIPVKNFCRSYGKFSLLRRKESFPEAVRIVSAKFFGVFLCSLLKRLRFSPEIVFSFHESAKKSQAPGSRALLYRGPDSGDHCIYVCIYPAIFPDSRLLRGVLFGSVDENGQHCNGKNDADGVCHSRIVNGSAFSGLAVQ